MYVQYLCYTYHRQHNTTTADINPLNAELNPTCHLLAFLGAHHILHISRIRVNYKELYDCKWDPMTLTNNTLYRQAFKFFLIFWPDDGLHRPKLGATI